MLVEPCAAKQKEQTSSSVYMPPLFASKNESGCCPDWPHGALVPTANSVAVPVECICQIWSPALYRRDHN